MSRAAPRAGRPAPCHAHAVAARCAHAPAYTNSLRFLLGDLVRVRVRERVMLRVAERLRVRERLGDADGTAMRVLVPVPVGATEREVVAVPLRLSVPVLLPVAVSEPLGVGAL